ncbi:ComEC/Rec2 family competence protein [Nesterenkonia sp. NBAIMH1]|uniref:ComEC/Rec2 family competence protein n=1 Tax=Nesterenkonia sp. NBAIMH1 TaxID=2600320 RepID=UPI0011B46217|nr:ComEC/Rec2 family competence protein [Nesterenkonia sp. NBAIMH1]
MTSPGDAAAAPSLKEGRAARASLDLRLLPAAVVAFAAALAAVHLPAAGAWQLAGLAAGTGGAAAVLAFSLGQGRGRAFGVQWMFCAVLAAAVCAQAAAIIGVHEESGWDAAVQDRAEMDAVLRITEDVRPLADPGWGGQQRILVRAVVDRAQLPGQDAFTEVNAETVLISQVPFGAHPSWMFEAGQRYGGTVRTAPTDAGERATALIFPEWDGLDRLPEDRWSRFTGVFNDLRSATKDASAGTVGDAAGLLPGVILGDRTAMDEELAEAMYTSGLSHMTVVSGTHCSLIVGALLGLIRLCRMPRWCSPVLIVVGLVLFVLLVQPAPSVIRAAVMGSIGAMAVFAGRGRASSALLCLCVVALLLYDPYFSTEPAFQLSVTATAGIVLTGQPMKEIFEQRMPVILAGPLALAASSQLFVTPVLLPIAAGVNTYSIPANIAAGPLLPFVTVPGTLAAVLSTAVPWLSHALLWLAGFPAAGIAVIGRTAAGLPQALAPWPEGPVGLGLVLVYLSGSVVLSRLLIGRRAPRRWEKVALAVVAGAVAAVISPG